MLSRHRSPISPKMRLFWDQRELVERKKIVPKAHIYSSTLSAPTPFFAFGFRSVFLQRAHDIPPPQSSPFDNPYLANSFFGILGVVLPWFFVVL